MQLFIAPTYARKFNPSHSFGITPIVAYQRFEAQGVLSFAPFSSDASNLSNNGHESAFGYGIRVGYYGEISPKFAIGGAFQSKIYMNELDMYKGLFAEQGDFDIPANWTVGVAVKPNDALAIALDVQTILYSDVASINNPLLPNIGIARLGDDGGAGFGWDDMTVIKIGAQYQMNPDWTLRAGLSYGEQPIPDSEMLFNILAPGVVETHLTFGFTKKMSDTSELDFSVMHAFDKSISGPNTMEAPGAETIELTMNQWEFSLGYSWKF
jgi:long-chain fatty acid transport protein